MHVDALEPRVLLTSAVLLNTGVIDVTGTRHAETLYLNLRKGRLKVTANGQVLAGFRLRRVAELHVTAGAGDDTVIIAASVPLPCYVVGDAGNDTISAATTAAYADTIEGGAGDDHVTGGAGDDVLTGGDGNDTLVGNAGDDALYGRAGADRLDAGPGRDALPRGIGAPDTLTGGPGDDRFLLPKSPTGDTSEDAPADLNAAAGDARVFFAAADANWADDELEGIDSALDILHHASVADTRLLHDTPGYYWSDVGKEMTFYRFPVLKGGAAAATNRGGGTVNVADSAFNDITGTILHEMGHNWQFINNNPYWNKGHDFNALSSWKVKWNDDDPTPPGMAETADGEWFYDPNAPFVSDYAKTYPGEDYAETFKNYFLHSRKAAAAWAPKWDYIDAFLKDMNANPMTA